MGAEPLMTGLTDREIRKEAAKRFPVSYAAQNAFLRSALGWVPPPRVRLSALQKKAVSEGSAFARAKADAAALPAAAPGIAA